MNKLPSRPYFDFHSKVFLENANLAISAHGLKPRKFGGDRSIKNSKLHTEEHFFVDLIFHYREFPEIPYLSRSLHVIYAVQVWLRSVYNEGSFTGENVTSRLQIGFHSRDIIETPHKYFTL